MKVYLSKLSLAVGKDELLKLKLLKVREVFFLFEGKSKEQFQETWSGVCH